MNSSQIRCFLDLAQTTNFTETAQNLYLTQQAVSRRIHSLESSLGTELFVRSRSNVQLSEAGVYYRSVFTTIMEQFKEFQSEANVYYEILSSNLKIGYSEWIDRYGLIADGIDAFRNAMEDTQVTYSQLPNRELFNALIENKVDLALFSSEQTPNHRSLCSTSIAQEDIRLFGPEEVVRSAAADAYTRCWDLPLLFTSSWEYDYLEQSLLGAETRKELSLNPIRTKIVPDIASQFAELQFNQVAAIGDYNFGIYRRIPHLLSVPLHVRSSITCVWHRTCENPLVQRFTAFMREYYHFRPEE